MPGGSAKYGVLLVGGNRTHQETHAVAFAADPRCELVAVTDAAGISDERAELDEALASEHGIPFVPDLGEALALPGIDIVSMCAAIEDRGEAAVACARAGKALFLDKPLAGSIEAARAIRDAINESGARNQMYSYTGLPWAVAAKECIDSGRIGELRAIHADVLFAKGRAGTAPEGAVRREKSPPERFTFIDAKREFFDLGVYSVGLCLWLVGRRATEVTAITGNHFFAPHVERDIEDFGAVAMQLEEGVVATATGGRIGYHSHPKGGPHKIVVVGSEGTETFDAWTPHIEISADEPYPTLPPPNPTDPMMMWRSTRTAGGNPAKEAWVALADESNWYPLDIARFVNSLESGARPDVTVEEATGSLEVLLAAYESAARGETVRVERV